MISDAFREDLVKALDRVVNAPVAVLKWIEPVIEANMVVSLNSQHIYHHNDNDKPKINVKVEKNSKGYNYEATVTNAASVDEALALIQDAIAKLKTAYDVANS